MKWYFKVLGGHTHVRVFMNHAKCGDLCFRNEEFKELRNRFGETILGFSDYMIEFVEE